MQSATQWTGMDRPQNVTHMLDLTDAEALERLVFDLLWYHALTLKPEGAHLPQQVTVKAPIRPRSRPASIVRQAA